MTYTSCKFYYIMRAENRACEPAPLPHRLLGVHPWTRLGCKTNHTTKPAIAIKPNSTLPTMVRLEQNKTAKLQRHTIARTSKLTSFINSPPQA